MIIKTTDIERGNGYYYQFTEIEEENPVGKVFEKEYCLYTKNLDRCNQIFKIKGAYTFWVNASTQLEQDAKNAGFILLRNV